MKLRRLPQPNPTAGFTLIEMLAVIVIVAVLAAISAPSWLAYATRQRMTAVESDLVQVLKQAQQTAIAQRRTVTVTIIDEDNPGIPTVEVDGTAQSLGPGELRPGMIILDSPNAPNNEVTFDYQGTTRGAGTTAFVVDIRPGNNTESDNWRQCVAVATLLGNVKAAKGADCDDFLTLVD